MATSNIKEKNIYNTMEFVIEKIEKCGEHFFHIDNKQFDEEDFSKSFIPSFCLTVSR